MIIVGLILILVGWVYFLRFLWEVVKLRIERNELRKDEYFKFLEEFEKNI